MAAGDLKAAVEGALKARMPGFSGAAEPVRLSGGASQETWAMTLRTATGERDVILRRSPGGASGGTPLAGEAAVIRAARARGVPAPEILHVFGPDDGVGDGYLMDRIAGETLPRKILRDGAFDRVRPGLARQCGTVLAAVHAVDTGSFGMLRAADGAQQLRHYCALYQSYGQAKPVFELAFTWLWEQVRAPRRPVLVHGDFRHGNLMIHPDQGLAAVLDWELCHLGDALEDLGWLCVNSWRFGVSEKPVGGFGALDDLLEAYAAAGGEAYSAAQVKVWEVLGTLKWGIMCLSMYEAFRTGFDRTVERAAIGRRVSECEIDLVNLLLG